MNFAAADAGSAGTQTLARAIHNRPNTLQIYIPAAIRHIMGVADFVPKLGFLAANFTYTCHLKTNSWSVSGRKQLV